MITAPIAVENKPPNNQAHVSGTLLSLLTPIYEFVSIVTPLLHARAIEPMIPTMIIITPSLIHVFLHSLI